MGILNITPDSFYDGNNYKDFNYDTILKKFKHSDIIDVGCESSRPGSNGVDGSIQIERLNLFLTKLNKRLKFPLSIDSTNPEVIRYALDNGFSIINDISGGIPYEENFALAKEYNAFIVIMHMQNTPRNMQNSPRYSNVVEDVHSFFQERIDIAMSYGLKRDQIILDPGFGFGKTVKHNFELLNSFDRFNSLKCLMMAGVSRKSFLSIDNNDPKDRLLESLFAANILIEKGVHIIRVHDTYETYRTIKFSQKVESYGN